MIQSFSCRGRELRYASLSAAAQRADRDVATTDRRKPPRDQDPERQVGPQRGAAHPRNQPDHGGP